MHSARCPTQFEFSAAQMPARNNATVHLVFVPRRETGQQGLRLHTLCTVTCYSVIVHQPVLPIVNSQNGFNKTVQLEITRANLIGGHSISTVAFCKNTPNSLSFLHTTSSHRISFIGCTLLVACMSIGQSNQRIPTKTSGLRRLHSTQDFVLFRLFNL